MKYVIISDIHDNIPNLEKCLNWCKKEGIEQMICCGDVANIDTVAYLSKNFPGTIYLVRGNICNYEDQEVAQFENIQYFGQIGYLTVNNMQIGLCHEPYLIEKVLEKPCQIVFHGHTHKPWIAERKGAKEINPGALSGLYYDVAIFAVWEPENGKIELKRIEEI